MAGAWPGPQLPGTWRRGPARSEADGLLIVDEQGVIGVADRQVEALFGYESTELIGRHLSVLVPQSAQLGASMLGVAGTFGPPGLPRSVSLLADGRHSNGSWLDLQLLAWLFETGRGVSAVVFVREITSTTKGLSRDELDLRPQGAAGSGARRRADDVTLINLGRRELEILKLLAGGLPNKEIAEQLNISLNTVRNHVKSILNKLGAHTRLQAVAIAVYEGVIGREDTRPFQ
ncbi:MAG TPA: LuxR C-terminal-related transcriptional regulator [Acidimicrobiales bacterium]|nr:LuxR C-terminal-related transcriptional regulator [Acidimicrobiales bacterium]